MYEGKRLLLDNVMNMENEGKVIPKTKQTQIKTRSNNKCSVTEKIMHDDCSQTDCIPTNFTANRKKLSLPVKRTCVLPILPSYNPSSTLSVNNGLGTVESISDGSIGQRTPNVCIPYAQISSLDCTAESDTGDSHSYTSASTDSKYSCYRDIQRNNIQNKIDWYSIVCKCGHQAAIELLIKKYTKLVEQNKKLKTKYDDTSTRCMSLTDALSSKLIGQPRTTIFTEVAGYPDQNKLRMFSDAANKSDYIFVKLLMLHLWPDGLQNRTVTGRASNNPLGRSRQEKSTSFCPESSYKRIALESEKVEYISNRLLEHRLFLGDAPSIAKRNADECCQLMARVISYYGKKR
ncbi:uncharacterized protein LOC131429822 [Malaya genurostris]|uniref:uncharacterized protein LOC131429822 n=1 Tax=Malaya genurostris TaxID=325434 RepID=UPI0026F401B7|nr:uncharacterized protein LOC131429822 [Malaya genurostris]